MPTYTARVRNAAGVIGGETTIDAEWVGPAIEAAEAWSRTQPKDCPYLTVRDADGDELSSFQPDRD